LPLPLGGLLTDLISSGREIGLEIDQQQIEGDPLLLVKLPEAYDHDRRQFCLESLELTQGEIYLAGRSDRQPIDSDPLARQPNDIPQPTDHAEAVNRNLHR
jgi:hypothetical protein